MTANTTKRGFRNPAEEDRISNLPENLIDSILEKLPVQDAIRTNILSKYWRYKWTTMTKLVLDKQFSEKFTKNGAFDPNGFITITNQILNLHKGAILTLNLHVPDMLLGSFQEVDQWILHLSRNGVRELVLTNSNRRYHLPSYMYLCTELRNLQLEKCILKPPPEFQGFIFMEDLFLTEVDFGDKLYKTMITLPQVKNLTVHKCINIHSFNIKSPILQNLIEGKPVNRSLDRSYPSFVYCCLNLRKLHLQTPCILNSPLDLQRYLYLKALSLSNVEFGATLYGKLVNLPQLKTLTLIRCRNVHNFNLQASNLRYLTIFTLPDATLLQLSHNIKLGDLDQLQGLLWMLQNSLNLERLSVLKLQLGLPGMNLDEQPAISYLEAAGCSIQTFNQLKIVEILSIEGSI
uniref:F-box/FBD/LRR-repeat protein At2g04230-like n=1 Tax=Erigeron canadensis TaxID=72917 RepID=UPI001CB94042|nr:F-box/FBD/LRR-repeat protein At2g04230-like [Erigeron canadensis]